MRDPILDIVSTFRKMSTKPDQAHSDTVHAGIRDLEQHHVETSNGEIIALKNEPKVNGLEVWFLMATELLISALEGFAAILEVDLGDFCNESKRSLKSLADAR